MRKKLYQVLVLFLLGFAIATCVSLAWGEMTFSQDVQSFNVDEYVFFIENFSLEEKIELVSNPFTTEELIEKVEAYLIERYGADIRNQRPYMVKYDKIKRMWLVHGTLSGDLNGGVAYVILDGNSGCVVAVWHEK